MDQIKREAKRLHLSEEEVDRLIIKARKERELKEDVSVLPLHKIAATSAHAVEHYKVLIAQIRQLGIMTHQARFVKTATQDGRLSPQELGIWWQIQGKEPLSGASTPVAAVKTPAKKVAVKKAAPVKKTPAVKPAATAKSTTATKKASSNGSSSSGSTAATSQTSSTVSYRYGVVQVKVTKKSGKITAVDVLQGTATDGRDAAFPTLVQATIDNNGTNFGNLSRATYTTDAFKRAVNNALAKF